MLCDIKIGRAINTLVIYCEYIELAALCNGCVALLGRLLPFFSSSVVVVALLLRFYDSLYSSSSFFFTLLLLHLHKLNA